MSAQKSEFRKRLQAEVPKWIKALEDHKGDRAKLRRAQREADVYAVEMAHRLVEALRPEPKRTDAAFFLAALLSHVREEVPEALIDRLLKDTEDGKPEKSALKPQRFGQLLHADLLPDRLRLFRRALQMVDGKLDAADLAELFLTWPDNSTKRDFARRYFAYRSPHDNGDDTPAAVPSTSA